MTTVSKQGKIIEKFNLFSRGCSEDEFSWEQAKYVIDKDLKIVQTDSSAIYERTENGKIINEATLSSSHRFEFQVDANGKIRKHLSSARLQRVQNVFAVADHAFKTRASDGLIAF